MRILKVGRTIIIIKTLPQQACTYPTRILFFITPFLYPSYYAWFIVRSCQRHRLRRVVNDELERIWKGAVVTLYYYPSNCPEKLMKAVKSVSIRNRHFPQTTCSGTLISFTRTHKRPPIAKCMHACWRASRLKLGYLKLLI